MAVTSRHEHERVKRQRRFTEDGAGYTMLTASVPASLKAWLSDEAYRREIPVSWLVTEVLDTGIEAYKLMGADEQPPSNAIVETDAVALERAQGYGPTRRRRRRDRDIEPQIQVRLCAACKSKPAIARDKYSNRWLCADC
jgi:hypothetical protein